MIRQKLHIHVHSPLLIGGYSSHRPSIDKASARLREDDPGSCFIPGSAIKGALRITLESLLRGLGHEPQAPINTPEYQADGSDFVNQIFGNSDFEGLLRVGAATLVEGALSEAVRPGIGVDRHTGSVLEKRLFFHQTAMPSKTTVLECELEWRERPSEEQLDLFASCVQATDQIGGGAARGCGRVRLELGEIQETPLPGPASSCAPVAGRATLLLEFESPFHIGDQMSADFYQASLVYVPGSTLRGALGTALAERGAAGMPVFFRFFGLDDGSRGVSISDALPTKHESHRDFAATLTPLCFQPAKGSSGGPRHNVLPRLLALASHLEMHAGAAPSPTPASVRRESHGQLVPGAALLAAPPKRVWTRVSLDRHTLSARDRMLHSLELTDATRHDAWRFLAEVSGLDDECLALLSRLDGQELRLGHGRSVGLGRARLRVRPWNPPIRTVTQRLEQFQEQVQSEQSRLGIVTPPQHKWLPLLLLTPFPASPSLPHPLGDVDGLSLHRAFTQTQLLSGWDLQVRQQRARRWAFTAGSVFVYQIPPDTSPESLSHWEERGAQGLPGEDPLGYGRFAVVPERLLESKI